jgi:L-cysteine S-thiosulfotransferase
LSILSRSLLLATGLGLGLAGMAGAMVVEPGDAKIVDGVSADALTDQAGAPDAGKAAMADRKGGNCLACHVNTDQADEDFQGDIGPPLDGVAERWSTGELRAIVINSKAVLGEETVMPAFYRVIDNETVDEKFVGKTILDAQQVEDIVAYLSTLKE